MAVLICLLNSFLFKANCFDTNELSFAKTAEISFAALKLSTAIAANIYELKK
ncbi:hypothetical protein GF322_01400 [Candidatus Dependentiae bacterium]|nr:hypothetical protein [Candidatus Dependentiae bacterium]